MEIVILDKELKPIKIIEEYDSIIWTDRFRACGEFELYMPFNESLFDVLKIGNYVEIPYSKHTMIINKIVIETDSESGNFITVTGESLESLLKRRIIWGTVNFNNERYYEAILSILSDNIGPYAGVNGNRGISNLIIPTIVMEEILGHPIPRITAQYTGTNLYDTVIDILEQSGITLGFTILRDGLKFRFDLEQSVYRSYASMGWAPFVVFSPSYDNLLNSKYMESDFNEKNVALIGGEDEGVNRKFAVIDDGKTGFDRREIFVDARDISSYVDYETVLTDDAYKELLIERGYEVMADYNGTVAFEGDVDPDSMFKLNEDYSLGDIVQIENEYGFTAESQIVEIVICNDRNGFRMYPTFEKIE